MQPIVYGLFDSYNDAHEAVLDLMEQGYDADELNVITQASTLPTEPVAHENIDDGASAGANVGAVMGGLTGLLAGISAVAIPGFGPILAAGPLLTALSATAAGAGIGAITGSLVGALVDWGIPDDVAHTYAEAVKKGHILLAVPARRHHTETVETIFAQHSGWDINVYEFASPRVTAHN